MELRTTKNNLEEDVRKLTILYEMYAQSIVGQWTGIKGIDID